MPCALCCQGYICSNVDTAEGKGKRVVDILKPWIDDWSSRQQDKVRLSFAWWGRPQLRGDSQGRMLF